MAYICFCRDVENSTPLRQANTAAHLAYIEKIMGRVLVAGPMAADSEGDYSGSTFIYDVESREEALQLLHNDPYFRAGLYTDVACRYFRPAAGNWIGGKTWK